MLNQQAAIIVVYEALLEDLAHSDDVLIASVAQDALDEADAIRRRPVQAAAQIPEGVRP